MQIRDAGGTPQYMVSGFTNSFNSTNNYNPIVYKTDLAGNLLWTKTYGGQKADYAYEIDEVTTTAAGALSYILTGSELSFTAGQNDILLIEMDNVGICWWKL